MRVNTSTQMDAARHDAGLSRFVGWPGVFFGVCALGVVTFLVLPWSIQAKSMALLHGLCAQQPSHSFFFDGTPLPFDARMTGIYGGVAAVWLVLTLRGRWRYAGVPPLRVILILVGFIGIMGIDGLNSTLLDLRRWHLYTPHNALRLGTGMLSGIALGVFIWMLVCQIGFARHSRIHRSSVSDAGDLSWVVAAGTAYCTVVLTQWPPLRIPLTLLLVAAALAAVAGLVFGFVLLLSGRESVATQTRDLAAPATAALVIALVLIGMLSGGRFALEAWLGLPTQLQGMV